MSLTSFEVWIVFGVFFLLLELAVPSFFALFFGIGAFCVAGLSYLGILEGSSAHLMVFALISVASLGIFRKEVHNVLSNRKTKGYVEHIGEKVKVVETIWPGQEGRVLYRGSEWIAISKSSDPIQVNQTATILHVDGIRLLVG